MNNPSTKYISFVLVGRNDDYGGDFKVRLQNCINGLFNQLNQFNIPSEIIFVNYNPLIAPPISSFINWPTSNENVTIRIIEVPNTIHKQFIEENNVKDVPVIEYLAKNIGIRRCHGEYIACVNPDIIFSNDIIKQIKNGLNPLKYYRAHRIDFQQKDGKMELLRIHLKGLTAPIKRYNFFNRFILNLGAGVKAFYYKKTIKFERIFNLLSIPVIYDTAEYYHHCKVSGDFMLMSRNGFFELNGYYETAPIALHIDSLFVIQAAAKGLKEYVFKKPIFHQDHERRYTADEKKKEEKDAYAFFQKEAKMMLQSKQTKIYNNSDWGLNKIELYEQIV